MQVPSKQGYAFPRIRYTIKRPERESSFLLKPDKPRIDSGVWYTAKWKSVTVSSDIRCASTETRISVSHFIKDGL